MAQKISAQDVSDRQDTPCRRSLLYSYRLPEGARSIISRDLNVSLNEYLSSPPWLL